MRALTRRVFAVAALLALAACGDLPQPFRGNPGGMAGALTAPPAYRLAIPEPAGALLPAARAAAFAEALSETLLANEVPAAATAPLPLDWRLTVEASLQGNSVVPRYRLTDPDGQAQGAAEGALIPARDWSVASADTLRAAARDAAPRVAQLLLRAEAARKSSDPAALSVAGPPRIFVPEVRGAPGDGNRALTVRLREALAQQGMLVQDVTEGARFAVTGQVDVVNQPRTRTQRIEILWTVSRRDGEDLGRVLQLNEVPAGVLERFWGDVAYAAATEAAGGVRTVVQNAGGFPPEPGAAPGAPPRPAGLALPRDPDALPTPTPPTE
ncbi:hypothetical protein J5Y09_02040 [Roseomonas sp. PWR1]|uniref:Lipoprotein n=1 Tax=Roseomonas nitratireducens TaxID=2820810 RepID=A0ABS4AMT8_9PROT|nr:hypothetical protein [Neoroseomonas nitratireducens]MBP0462680.1 hypothetical protein [Neoroseomonas nitratireducens]